MTKIFVIAVIDAPIEKVWAKVRDFNNLPDWHPKFSRSHIEGGLPSDRIGCVRNFDIAGGGGTIRERLLELSDIEHSLRYCIFTSPLPVMGRRGRLSRRGSQARNCRGSLRSTRNLAMPTSSACGGKTTVLLDTRSPL